MSTLSIGHFHLAFDFPAKQPPTWHTQVERWYQLDAYAYGLAELYQVWRQAIGKHAAPPDMLILASPEASNRTDASFAQSVLAGNPSPAKFTHTLPNIRSTALCQCMSWSGPILCLQSDPHTIVQAIVEGAWLLKTQANQARGIVRLWILSVIRAGEGYAAHLLTMGEQAGDVHLIERTKGATSLAMPTDEQLLYWLGADGIRNPFTLTQEMELQR